MSHSFGVSRRLRPVLMALVVVATGLTFQAAPTSLPLPRPEALQPSIAQAAYCASNPGFTGYLTATATSTVAVTRLTNPTVYGYISNVDAAWSCTAFIRYSGLAWNTTSTIGTFVYGNLINSTTVACNWIVGSTDYLKANSSADCADTDAEYAMAVSLDTEQAYTNNAAHTAAGQFSFVHLDCDTYYFIQPTKTAVSVSTASTANRPNANCDPVTLDGTGVSQPIVYDHTVPTGTSISIASGAASTASNLVSLTLAAADNVSGVAQMRFSNNGSAWSAWETYATTRASWDMTSATYGGTNSDGTQTVYVQFQDANANGPSATIHDTIVLDRTAPTGTVSINSAATYTTSGSVSLTLSATDTLSTVSQMRFSNNGSSWSAFETYATTRAGWDLTSATYGGTSSEGTKPVYVQFKDSLGNAGNGTGISDTITYDATPANPSPPDVTCTGTGVYQPALNGVCYFRPAASTLTVTGSASDSVSGVQYLRFQNLTPTTNWTPSPALPNNDTLTPFTEGLTFNGSTGNSTIEVLARNGAGLDGSVRTVSLTVDNTVPTAAIAYPEAYRSLAGDVVVTGTATDSQTFKEYQLEYGAGSSPSSWTSIGIYSSPVAGTDTLATWSTGALTGVYTVRLTVRDQVGSSATASSLVYLENTRRGDESYTSRVPFELGGGYTLDIGVANGEARLSRGLFSIPSYGPPQELDLTYSSLESATTGKFGVGWSSNLTQYVTFESGFVVWHRADGGRVPFGLLGSTWTPLRGHFEVFGTGSGVYTVTLKDQTKLTFESTGAGRLTKIENRFAKALTLAWGTSSATATDASGRVTTLTIDSANNRITGATDSAGRTWSFGYTGTDLTTITDPASKVTTLAYTSHALTSVTRSRSRVSGSPESVVWGIGYTSGKATSVTDPIDGAAVTPARNTFTYTAGSTTVDVLKAYGPSPAWDHWVYTLDHFGRVSHYVGPDGGDSVGYDDDSNLENRVSSEFEGNVVFYTYDGRGNPLSETVDAGDEGVSRTIVALYSYSSTNDLLTKSEADGDAAVKLVTLNTYDGTGHLILTDVNCTTTGTTPPTTASTCTGAGTQDSATNLITKYAYTGNHQLAYEQDPLGRVTKHTYDTSGNETSVISNCTTAGSTQPSPFDSCTAGGLHDAQTNVTTTTEFDQSTTAGKAGLPTRSADPVASQASPITVWTTWTYDALGRRVSETRPGDSSIPSATQTIAYDELGNTLTGTDTWTPLAGGSFSGVTSHVYDLVDRETSLTDAAGNVATTTYDAAGNAVGSVENGVTTSRTFDSFRRLLSEDSGSGPTTHMYDSIGDEIMSVDAEGSATYRGFTYNGLLVEETVAKDALDLTTTFDHDSLGRTITSTDPLGAITTTTYDRPGRALTSAVGGQTTTTGYDRAGNAISLTDAAGILTTSVFDPLDRQTTVVGNDVASPTLPSEDVTTRTYYDAAGTMIGTTDPKGITARTIANVRGLAKTTIANCTDDGTAPPSTSDPAACVGDPTPPLGTNIRSNITYDGSGSTVLTVTAVGTGAAATTETAFDGGGRVQAVKDPIGTVSRTFYVDGRIAKTVVNCTTSGTTVLTTAWEECTGAGTQDGTFNLTTTYGYDSAGNKVTEVAPNGRVTTSVYDGANRLVTTIDNDVASPTGPTQNVMTQYYYDAAGRQAAVRVPTSDGTSTVTSRYLYNDDGTLFREIHNCTDSGTTPPSNPGTCTGAGSGTDSVTNVVTEYAYDTRHNRTKTIAPDPSATATGTGLVTTRSAYDSSNRLCRVVENSTQTDGQWAALANPCTTAISGTNTTNLSTRYGYDGNGNMTSMIDALGQTTTYAFDQRGQAIATTDALGKTIAWTYDALGHRISQENRSDPPYTNSVLWTYDGAGRILTRVADGITTTYTYDANGNKQKADDGTYSINATYDRLNRVVSVDDEDAFTVPDTTYTYSLTSPSWIDPTGAYSATLDKFDRATATNDPANATDFTATYGADGHPLTTSDPNGNGTAFAYDRLGRLTSKNTTATGPVNRALYAWTYNRAGQVLSEASTITGDPANGTITYAYDPLARLTSSAVAGTTTAYGWDKVPNRTSVQVGAGTAATTTFNAANRPSGGANPTAAYTSDDDGRLTARPGQTMTWDDLGRLKEVKNAGGTILATYTYDPLDRLRMVDYGASVRTRFRYVGLTTSAAQLIDDAAGTVTRNIGNGWTGERLLDWTGTNSNIRIYGTNGHHDVTWLASSTGTVSQSLRFDPWGNPRSTVPTGYTPFRFQGSFYDPTTDLSWVVTRWYAPALGTFISEDSLLGQPRDPDSRHLYAYGEGDPVGKWDADGRAVVSGGSGEQRYDLISTTRQDVTGLQIAVLKATFEGLCYVSSAATLVLAEAIAALCISGGIGIDQMTERIDIKQINYLKFWKASFYDKAIRFESRPALEIHQGGSVTIRKAPYPKVWMELHYDAFGQREKSGIAHWEDAFRRCSGFGSDYDYRLILQHSLGVLAVRPCGAYSGEIKAWKDPWSATKSNAWWGDPNVVVATSRKWPHYWHDDWEYGQTAFWRAGT